MPFLPIFAAAAQVGHYEHPAGLKPDATGRIEAGRQIDAIAAIAVKESRVVAIELEALFAQDVERHFSAIFGGGEFAHHFDVVEAGRRSHVNGRAPDLVAGRIKGEPGRRGQVADIGKDQIVSVPGCQPGDSGYRQDWDVTWPSAAAPKIGQ